MLEKNQLVFLSELEFSSLNRTLPSCVPIDKLDERYFAFARSLDHPFNVLALDQKLFMGKGDSKPITSLKDVYCLATSLPWLFAEAFPALSEAEILDISEAGTLLIMALLLLDPYLDGQLPRHPGIPLLYSHLHTAALRKFSKLFDDQSLFWPCFSRYFSQYTVALIEENTHFGQMIEYSLEAAYQIGSGKVALLKAITTAMALKAGAQNHITRIEHAVDSLAAAMQLGDDIEDWKEDYERERYTLPITQVIPPDLQTSSSLTVTEINMRFEESVILETLVKQMIDWYQDALNAVADLPGSHWKEYVNNYQTVTRAYLQSLVAKKLLKLMST